MLAAWTFAKHTHCRRIIRGIGNNMTCRGSLVFDEDARVFSGWWVCDLAFHAEKSEGCRGNLLYEQGLAFIAKTWHFLFS